jgi:DNA-binding beta-propeller fold protein YncE
MACMKRRELLAAALLVAAEPARALGAVAGGGVVARVTADLESHVAALDVFSGRIVKRIRTAPGPRSVESSPFGTVVVAHIPGGVVTIVDATTLTVRSALRGFGTPRYTAMHPSEPIAYVSDSELREVVTIDLARASVLHRTRVPGPARHISTDGRTLWTALGSAAERVAALDLSDPRRPRLACLVMPPFPAHDVVFAPDGEHVWVTSGARNALALYRLAGGPPTVFAAGAPPQHVAFVLSHAYVANGADGTVQRRRLDGAPVHSTSVPHGSYHVTCAQPETSFGRAAVITPSLDEGTVAVLAPGGRLRLVKHVARSTHDACVVQAG